MSTSIFVGHAKPPSNTVSGQMYTILSVVCEVEMTTGVIVAAEFTVATELAKDYLNRLLAGRNLNTDEDAIVAELESCYFSGTQKALIQCFRDMAKRYRAQVGVPAGRAGRKPAGSTRSGTARGRHLTAAGMHQPSAGIVQQAIEITSEEARAHGEQSRASHRSSRRAASSWGPARRTSIRACSRRWRGRPSATSIPSSCA